MLGLFWQKEAGLGCSLFNTLVGSPGWKPGGDTLLVPGSSKTCLAATVVLL